MSLNDTEVSIENLGKLTKELQNECSKLGDLLGEGAKLKLDVSKREGERECASVCSNVCFVQNSFFVLFQSCLSDFSGVGSTFKDLRQVRTSIVIYASNVYNLMINSPRLELRRL